MNFANIIHCCLPRDGRHEYGNDIQPGAGAITDNRDNGDPAPRILNLPRGPPQPSNLLFEFLAALPEVTRRSAREFGHTGFIWPSVDEHIYTPSTPGGN